MASCTLAASPCASRLHARPQRLGATLPHRRSPARRTARIHAQNDPSKVVREFSEETGKTIEKGKEAISQQRPKENVSAEMKQKMRNEYLGLGGSPNEPLKVNYFVVISVVIASLAVLSKLAGYI